MVIGVLAQAVVTEARGIGSTAGQQGFSTSSSHGAITCQTAAMVEVGIMQMKLTARAKNIFKMKQSTG